MLNIKRRVTLLIVIFLTGGYLALCFMGISGIVNIFDKSSNGDVLLYGNSNGNIINGGYVLKIDDLVFINEDFLPEQKILYQYHIEDKVLNKVAEDCNGSLNIYNNHLFYSTSDGIVCSSLNGTVIDHYYDSSCNFIIYDAKIFLVDNYIYSVDIASKEKRVLNAIDSADVNVAPSKIYYTSQDSVEADLLDEIERMDWGGKFGQIYHMNLDGSKNELLNESIVCNLIYNQGYLYYILFEDFTLGRIDLKTGEKEKLTDSAYENFNIEDEKLVCSNSETIDVLDLNGKIINSYKLEETPRDPRINLIDNYVFYRRFASNKISMLDLFTGKSEIIVE